jgi:Spy/CpxP family protein refolding chaperone
MMMGRGGGLLGYLGIEEVQKELEMLDDQIQQCEQLREEMRPQRAEGEERPDFRNMSEEERQKFFADMQKQMEERRKKAETKLENDILLPHQMDRLREIAIQQAGIGALMMPEVAANLGLSDAQKEKIQTTLEESRNSIRDRMREIFQGGDRENMRGKLEELRKEVDNKVLAVLTASQKEKFEELKGKPFEMPQRRFFGGGQRGPGGPRGERPDRPQRPST